MAKLTVTSPTTAAGDDEEEEDREEEKSAASDNEEEKDQEAAACEEEEAAGGVRSDLNLSVIPEMEFGNVSDYSVITSPKFKSTVARVTRRASRNFDELNGTLNIKQRQYLNDDDHVDIDNFESDHDAYDDDNNDNAEETPLAGFTNLQGSFLDEELMSRQLTVTATNLFDSDEGYEFIQVDEVGNIAEPLVTVGDGKGKTFQIRLAYHGTSLPCH